MLRFSMQPLRETIFFSELRLIFVPLVPLTKARVPMVFEQMGSGEDLH